MIVIANDMVNFLLRISFLYFLGLVCLLSFLFIDGNVLFQVWLKYTLLIVGIGLPDTLTIMLIMDKRMERFNNHENHNY